MFDLLIESIQCSVYVERYFTRIKRLKMFRKRRLPWSRHSASERSVTALIDFLTFEIGNVLRGMRLPELCSILAAPFSFGDKPHLSCLSHTGSPPMVRRFHQVGAMWSEMAADQTGRYFNLLLNECPLAADEPVRRGSWGILRSVCQALFSPHCCSYKPDLSQTSRWGTRSYLVLNCRVQEELSHQLAYH